MTESETNFSRSKFLLDKVTIWPFPSSLKETPLYHEQANLHTY